MDKGFRARLDLFLIYGFLFQVVHVCGLIGYWFATGSMPSLPLFGNLYVTHWFDVLSFPAVAVVLAAHPASIRGMIDPDKDCTAVEPIGGVVAAVAGVVVGAIMIYVSLVNAALAGVIVTSIVMMVGVMMDAVLIREDNDSAPVLARTSIFFAAGTFIFGGPIAGLVVLAIQRVVTGMFLIGREYLLYTIKRKATAFVLE